MFQARRPGRVAVKKLLGLAIALVAIGAIVWQRHAPTSKPSWADWATEPIDRGTLVETVAANGAIQPRDMLSIGSESTGRVVRVLVEAGQLVKAGDALCQLDDRLAGLRIQQAKQAIEIAQADVARAEAGRDAAVAALQRARDPGGQIQPVAHVETAEFQWRSAEATVRAAQAKAREAQIAGQLADLAFEQLTVRAPVAGVILEKRVGVGQLVAPSPAAPLFLIGPELEQLQLTALVAEGDIGKVRVGQSASFTVNAWPELQFEGRVSRIGLAAAPGGSAVQYPVAIDAANQKDPASREWRLRTGMSATIELAVRRHDGVWRLPAAATGITLDESKISESARRKLARAAHRADRGDWQRVWLLSPERGPWPVFLRVGGKTSAGDTGIQDAQWIEVLAWDPEESLPEPNAPAPRVIVGVPDSAKPAKPGLKLF